MLHEDRALQFVASDHQERLQVGASASVRYDFDDVRYGEKRTQETQLRHSFALNAFNAS